MKYNPPSAKDQLLDFSSIKELMGVSGSEVVFQSCYENDLMCEELHLQKSILHGCL